MLKKLLKKIFYVFSYEYDKNQIEKYLAQSTDLYNLENRQRELDRKGTYLIDFIYKLILFKKK